MTDNAEDEPQSEDSPGEASSPDAIAGGDPSSENQSIALDSSDQPETESLSRVRSGTDWLIGGLRRLQPGVVRRNYLVKFGVAVLFVFVLITVAGILTIDQTTETLDQQVSAQLQTDADREVENLRSWRQQRARWLNELSRTRVMQNEQTEPISISLQQQADNIPSDVRLIHFINITSTEILASNERRKEGIVLDETSTPWAQEMSFDSANDVYVSDVYRDEGIPSIAFVAPIPERPDRAVVGVTRAQSPLTGVSDQRTDQFVSVINTEGEVLMDNRGDQYVGQRYAVGDNSDIADRLWRNESGFLDEAPNQEQLERDYVAAYSSMNDTGWVVVTHKAEDEAYLIRSNIISNLTQLVFVSLVGLALIGIVIAGGTVKSINRLAEKVEELERGNLDVELSTSREDEIGKLYAGFDSMRRSLQEQITELSEAIRAEERMRKQLTDTNEELENQRVIISVLNRLLRHNLRNSLTSILLHTQQLSDEISPEREENVDGIITTSERLLRRVEKSRRIEKIVGTDAEDLETVHVNDIVEESVELHRDEYTDATVSMTFSDETYARVGKGVAFVVDNLIENAIEHNDQSEPTVEVSLRSISHEQSQWVELVVEDDGPGIPEVETKVLEEGEETPLEHGSGVGLWLVNWLVEHVGGEFSFEDSTPRGTRAIVRFPAVEPPDSEPATDVGSSMGRS